MTFCEGWKPTVLWCTFLMKICIWFKPNSLMTLWCKLYMSTISNSWPKLSDTQEFMNDMGNVWGFHHSGTFDSNSFHFVMRFIRLTWYFFRVWNFKKRFQNMGLQKAGCKKQGHCYSKREETRLPLLFLNNNDLGFLHPAFFKKHGARFFTWSQTDPGFQNKNSGCRLTGRLWILRYLMEISGYW